MQRYSMSTTNKSPPPPYIPVPSYLPPPPPPYIAVPPRTSYIPPPPPRTPYNAIPPYVVPTCPSYPPPPPPHIPVTLPELPRYAIPTQPSYPPPPPYIPVPSVPTHPWYYPPPPPYVPVPLPELAPYAVPTSTLYRPPPYNDTSNIGQALSDDFLMTRLFENWMVDYKPKNYPTNEEKMRRFKVFKNTAKEIYAHNIVEGRSYSTCFNKFADWTAEERITLCGRLHGSLPYCSCPPSPDQLPKHSRSTTISPPVPVPPYDIAVPAPPPPHLSRSSSVTAPRAPCYDTTTIRHALSDDILMMRLFEDWMAFKKHSYRTLNEKMLCFDVFKDTVKNVYACNTR